MPGSGARRVTWTPEVPLCLGEQRPPLSCGGQHQFLLASSQEVKIDKHLEPGLRVTVRLNQQQLPGTLKRPQPGPPAGSEPLPCPLAPSSQPVCFPSRKQDLPWKSRVVTGPSHQSWSLLGLHGPPGLLPQ